MREDAKKRLKMKEENEKTQNEKFLQGIGYNLNLNSYDLAKLNENSYKLNSLTPSNSMKNLLIGKKIKEIYSDKDMNKTKTSRNNDTKNNYYLKHNSNNEL